MKKIISLIVIVTVLFSCKKEVKKTPLPNSILGLKTEKAKQEKRKDSIAKLVISIDQKLAKLDTIKKLQIVSTQKIVPTKYEHYITIQGNTKTDKNIMLRPQSNGLLTGVYVKEGQYVSRGKLLFQIDDLILRNSISEIQNQLLLANTTYERQQRLWNQKIGSEMQYLQAKNNKEALENKITTLNSQLKNYKVFAPFSGIVDDLMVVKGDLASPQMPLLQLINLSNMYIESDVAENYLKTIKKGNKAIVNFESIDQEVTARVSRVGNSISPENRSFKVRINVSNKNRKIKPNLLAAIKIKDLDHKDAIVIPSNLVQIDENGDNFVFVVTKNDNANIVVKKLIEVNSSYEEKSLITKGLEKDEILIIEGARNVSSDQEVKIL